MEVWIIYPIGGLLSILGVMVLLGLYAAFVGANEHQNIIEDFAARHTGVVLIVLLVIAVIFGAWIWHLFHKNSKRRPGFLACLLNGLTVAIPAFFSLTVCYLIVLEFLNGLIQSAAQGIIMVVLAICWTIPIGLVIYGIYCAVALAPNCLPLFLLKGNCNRWKHRQKMVYMWLLCIGLSAVYIVFMNLLPMFSVSFSNILP